MSISQVGSSYAYIYNIHTGKLSSKDGNQDDFVDYFNGELDGKISDTLNGFDSNKKRDIEKLIMLCEQNALRGFSDDPNVTEYEISGEIVDAVTSAYAINGDKIFTAYTAVPYSYDQIRAFTQMNQMFKTVDSKGYDPLDNSINIAVGDSFDLGNGYRLNVRKNCVDEEGDGSEDNNYKVNVLARGLEALIHFADQQGVAGMINAECTPMLLSMLRELGVDTEREFIINGTRCEVSNGRIREVGNTYFVPSSIYDSAVKKYEEQLYKPLSGQKMG